MVDVEADRRLQPAGRWRSWLVSSQLHETIAPRLRAGALLRWCVVAIVAFATATSPPRVPVLPVGWLVVVALYNALGQYGADVLAGRAAHRLAQGLVVADMAAMMALAAMYRGVPPANLSMGFILVLLEALLWYDWRGVTASIVVIGAGWAATDLAECLEAAGGTFAWRDFLGDLLTVGVVAVAVVLALRVLSATANRGAAEADASGTGAAVRIALSAREKEVLALISAGFSNRMIAARLHLAPSTVKSHVESILARLHARNRAEATAIAVRLRLLVDPVEHGAGDGEAAGRGRSEAIRAVPAAPLTTSNRRRL